MLQGIMQFISTVISIYMLIIFVRIVLSWFSGGDYGRVMDVLRSITDPYLNIFRGSRWTRIGYMDFSPVVAIIALSIVSNIASRIAFAGSISVGIVLAMTVEALASAISFFMVLFMILAGIRVVASFFNVDTAGRFWLALDEILRPVAARLSDRLTAHREVGYRNELFIFLGVLAIVLILGNIGIDYLALGLQRLPF
jgi:YggT family protein